MTAPRPAVSFRRRHPVDLDIDRLTLALEMAEINCWANPVRHEPGDRDEHRQHRLDAEAIAREYDSLASDAVLPAHSPRTTAARP